VWWFIFSDDIGSASTKRRAKAFPAVVSVSTSTASSGVAALLGGAVLGCFLLWLVSSRWKHFSESLEERRRRHRRCFHLEGVALEVMVLHRLWCFDVLGVESLVGK
jgi:uncharacterized membrane protein